MGSVRFIQQIGDSEYQKVEYEKDKDYESFTIYGYYGAMSLNVEEAKELAVFIMKHADRE